jgi:hypothetical protein
MMTTSVGTLPWAWIALVLAPFSLLPSWITILPVSQPFRVREVVS